MPPSRRAGLKPGPYVLSRCDLGVVKRRATGSRDLGVLKPGPYVDWNGSTMTRAVETGVERVSESTAEAAEDAEKAR